MVVFGLAETQALPAHADGGDNYPWKTGTAFPNCTLDTWGYCEQYCTSWVAFALHDRNGFEIPRGLGDASTWKDRASGLGYTADNTAAAGAVAWWNWNHVAWVKSVSADGQTVQLEEYNNPDGSGAYNTRSVAANNPEKYIHFKDLGSSSATSTDDSTADGKYISYHGQVYRIAGGAPLYVSGQDAPFLPGWIDNKTVTDAEWASLRAFPADGTYISDVQTGAVYVTVGGAPMYISGDDAPSLSKWASALPVPHWDFVHWQHLRQYPADGYYLRDVKSGFVYDTAGGAPFYVSGQDAPALPQWRYATPVPHGELVNHLHLRTMPADGTYITDIEMGAAYITLGGAPMYISGADASYLPDWAGATRVAHWEFQNWSYLQPYPADGYYLRDIQTNAVYVTAGGAPLYVSGQDAAWLPQWKYASPVPHWELQNWEHLRQRPADGTYVRGVPSGEVFLVMGGVATRITTNPLPAATTVDDWAITNQLGGTL